MSESNRRGFLKYMAGGIALAGTAGAGSLVGAQAANQQPLRIFLARRILTMDPNRPTATAVAVENGHILAVGSLAEVQASLGGRDAQIDPTFANQVILPGFVEAHCHIQQYGVFARVPYVGYFDRPTPDGGTQQGLRSLDDVIARLRVAVQEQVASTGNPSLPVLAFGADPLYFGGQHFTTEMLDQASAETPIFLQLTSGHVVCCNSPMLALVEQNAGWPSIENTSAVIRSPATNQPTGELDELTAEGVADAAFQAAYPSFYSPERLTNGLIDAGKLARRAGVTTTAEGKFSAASRQGEEAGRELYRLVTSQPDFPVRIVLDYFLPQFVQTWGNDAVQHLQEVRTHDTDKLITGPTKVIFDGSIPGYTAELLPPGYWNNDSNPIWNVEPSDFVSLCLPFWQAGFQIIVHANGDRATQETLDGLEQLLQLHPLSDHRFTVLHNQITHPEQFERMAQMGANANLFCNHIYHYGDQYYTIIMGPERATGMDSPAVAMQYGVPFSMHSDAPVTPLEPLFAAWCAVNRATPSGAVLGPEHRISVPDALHAITLGAAYLLKLEHEIGSIEVGKRADFAVLEENPLDVPPIELKDIPVTATVLGGSVFLNG